MAVDKSAKRTTKRARLPLILTAVTLHDRLTIEDETGTIYDRRNVTVELDYRDNTAILTICITPTDDITQPSFDDDLTQQLATLAQCSQTLAQIEEIEKIDLEHLREPPSKAAAATPL